MDRLLLEMFIQIWRQKIIITHVKSAVKIDWFTLCKVVPPKVAYFEQLHLHWRFKLEHFGIFSKNQLKIPFFCHWANEWKFLQFQKTKILWLSFISQLLLQRESCSLTTRWRWMCQKFHVKWNTKANPANKIYRGYGYLYVLWWCAIAIWMSLATKCA